MEKMNMLYKEQYISILHSVQIMSTVEHNVPLFMDLELKKKMKEKGDVRKELKIASPILHLSCTLLICCL